MECYCVHCGLVILKTQNATAVSKSDTLVVDKAGGGETEEVTEWFHVADQFSFENCAFTRESKNLPGGLRILTCAGCERGVIGKAMPSGEGPDIKMESFLAKSRVRIE